MDNKGFTMIELVMIVVVLGVIAVIALPKFIDLQMHAKQAADEQIAASVQSGINIYAAQSAVEQRSPMYPELLDTASNTNASPENPIFVNILESGGIINTEWYKLTDSMYRGSAGDIYQYASSSGLFAKAQILSDNILDELEITNFDITPELIDAIENDNTVAFDDGKILIGGSAVLDPSGGGEPTITGDDTNQELFSFEGSVGLELIGEYAGYAPHLKFGYYIKDPGTGTKTLYQLYDGSDGSGTIASFSVNQDDIVGFYLTTPEGPGYTYYSETADNPDGQDHSQVYENEYVEKKTIGWEDLYGGGDQDYQDFIVTISYSS
jgi:prepilin-type N-terminal cleavage/methylation domain-containing protein